MSHVPDYLRVIRLGCGKGEPGKQACWMTALQSHLGGQWTDQCNCVDPVINQFCIGINDAFGDDSEWRTEAIMEFGLFRPLGTAGDPEATKRRMWRLVDATFRRIVPQAFDAIKMYDHAEKLRSLPVIHDAPTASAASAALDAASYAASHAASYAASHAASYAASHAALDAASHAALDASYAASHAALDASYAALDASYAASHAASAASAASYAASHAASAASAASDARRKFIVKYCLPVLSELIEMGPHGPVERGLPVCGVDQFLEMVGARSALTTIDVGWSNGSSQGS